MIVPLNEKPRVEVVYLANSLTPLASAGYSNNNGYNSNAAYNNSGYNSNNQHVTPLPAVPSGFVKISNTFTNNYINAEKGPLACTVIDNEWRSAQWQIIPVTVNGTNYFTIQNRWKNSFLTIDNSGLLSSNGQSNTAMWVLDTQDGGNTYTIKNATRNAALADQNGMVETVPLVKRQQNARWVIEQ